MEIIAEVAKSVNYGDGWAKSVNHRGRPKFCKLRRQTDFGWLPPSGLPP